METKREEIILEQADKLRKMKLPEGWEVSKLEVSFTKKGSDIYKSAYVIYDDTNKTFYVRTAKSIVYPSEKEPMLEAIEVMNRANNIIK